MTIFSVNYTTLWKKGKNFRGIGEIANQGGPTNSLNEAISEALRTKLHCASCCSERTNTEQR